MALLEEIKRMEGEGRSEDEIRATLKSRGASDKDIDQSITESKIKSAVDSPGVEFTQPTDQSYSNEMPGMEPSMSQQPQSQSQDYGYSPEYSQFQPNSDPQSQSQSQTPSAEDPYAGYGYDPYASQAQYSQQMQSPQLSTDTISEIAEQIVLEKLSSLKTDLEKVLDLKNSTESKISYLDERLKRIEKIIDRLQLSILQKVGEYVTNVEDIKREMQETQKSFKSLLDKKK